MFCPQCKAEYREGYTECTDCRVPLVSGLPPEAEVEYIDLVTVLKSGNPAILAMAKSILDNAGIQYIAKGEALQDLFAAGRLGFGFNPITGPVEVQVDRDDREEALTLLDDLEENPSGELD